MKKLKIGLLASILFCTFGVKAHEVWVKGLGASLNQAEQDDIPGYNTRGSGFALGADWNVLPCLRLGVAGGYTKVTVVDKHEFLPIDQAIESWQVAAYGKLELNNGIYIDAYIAGASQDWSLDRYIHIENVLTTAAQADFRGRQFSAQGDFGWGVVNSSEYYFAPFVRLRYTHLDLNAFTETGAGFLNQSLPSRDLHEYQGGLGFKLKKEFQTGELLYVPEVSAIISYDFENEGLQTISRDLAADTAYATYGIEPGVTMFDLGLGLNTFFQCNLVLSAKYHLTLRENFVGNMGSLQFIYYW